MSILNDVSSAFSAVGSSVVTAWIYGSVAVGMLAGVVFFLSPIGLAFWAILGVLK